MSRSAIHLPPKKKLNHAEEPDWDEPFKAFSNNIFGITSSVMFALLPTFGIAKKVPNVHQKSWLDRSEG